MDNMDIKTTIKEGFEAVRKAILEREGEEMYGWLKPALINAFDVSKDIEGPIPTIFKILLDKPLSDEKMMRTIIDISQLLDGARQITMRAVSMYSLVGMLQGKEEQEIHREIDGICAEIETW